MKLAFPNGERDEFTVGKGSFSIGSTDQDDVVIADGLSGHAILTVDQRGITLSVDDLPASSVAVNGRPVRRRAILRLGDRVSIGGTEMVLRGGDLNTSTPPHPFEACTDAGEPAKVLLRGLTGNYSGRVFPVAQTIRIGTDDDADIRVDGSGDVRLAVGCSGDRLFLRHESGEDVLDVNGHVVRHAELTPGDQLAIGSERLLVEAPGFVPGEAYSADAEGAQGNTQVFQAISMDGAPDRSKGKSRDHDETDDAPEVAAALEANPGRWDALIISVCAVLSVAMLAWLYFVL